MIAAMWIIGYILMTWITFIGIAKQTNTLSDPWQSPAPFFSGILWPIVLPFVIPTVICFRLSTLDRGSNRVEKRRQKELEEAKHRKELARINAEALALKEREAGIK